MSGLVIDSFSVNGDELGRISASLMETSGYLLELRASMRQMRQRAKWSQAKMAAELGVSVSRVAKIERGKEHMTLSEGMSLIAWVEATLPVQPELAVVPDP